MKISNLRWIGLIIIIIFLISVPNALAKDDNPAGQETGPEFLDDFSSEELYLPAQLMFQGKLKGKPLSDGTYTVTLRLYGSRNGKDALWSETQNDAKVKDGMLSVILGRVNPVDLPSADCYYLGIEIDDKELSKRYVIACTSSR